MKLKENENLAETSSEGGENRVKECPLQTLYFDTIENTIKYLTHSITILSNAVADLRAMCEKKNKEVEQDD